MVRKSLKTLVMTSVASGVLLLGALPSGAGQSPTMTASPNPAYVGQTVQVSNTMDTSSTCEGLTAASTVHVTVTDPSSAVVLNVWLTPDGSGNWSTSFVAAMVGTYLANAYCAFKDGDFSGNSPANSPYFDYAELPIIVQAQQTTTTSTPTTVPSTTSTTQASTTSSTSGGGGGNTSGGNGAVSANAAFTG